MEEALSSKRKVQAETDAQKISRARQDKKKYAYYIFQCSYVKVFCRNLDSLEYMRKLLDFISDDTLKDPSWFHIRLSDATDENFIAFLISKGFHRQSHTMVLPILKVVVDVAITRLFITSF